jgi:hypothetical protein
MDTIDMNIVECLASDSYPGTPVAVMWEGTRRAVDVILNRWRDPHVPGYRIKTTDDLTLDLFYDVHAEAWRVSLAR